MTKMTCTGVEIFRKLLNKGRVGENAGVLLRRTNREDVEHNQVLVKSGSLNPHTQFKPKVYILNKDISPCVATMPFFKIYHPQFYFRIIDGNWYNRIIRKR